MHPGLCAERAARLIITDDRARKGGQELRGCFSKSGPREMDRFKYQGKLVKAPPNVALELLAQARNEPPEDDAHKKTSCSTGENNVFQKHILIRN